MKKKLILAVMATALCAMPLTAHAELKLTQLAEFDDCDFIDKTDLLAVRKDGNYAVFTATGEQLTESLYWSTMYGYYGMIEAEEKRDGFDTKGVLTISGEVLVPCQYADVDVLNEHWIRAVNLVETTGDDYDYKGIGTDSNYLIDKVDIYYVSAGEQMTAELKGTFTREYYADAKAEGEFLNIEDRASGTVTTYNADFEAVANPGYVWDFEETAEADMASLFYEDGKYGIQAADGTVILEPTYDIIYDLRYGYAEVANDDKAGLINEEGILILPTEFDSVETAYNCPVNPKTYETSGYEFNGYFAIVKDGKLGYAAEGGQITCEPKYDKNEADLNGCSYTFIDENGTTILVAADGVETALTEYSSVDDMYFSNGMYYEVENAEGNVGMIDWHGEVVLPCENRYVDFSGSGKYLLVRQADGPEVIYSVE